MPQYIIKLTDKIAIKDYYLMWSSVVDAPVTNGMSLSEFKEWYKELHGAEGMKELADRLERVERTGCSGYPPFDKFEDFLSVNRAGKGGKKISEKEILEIYCINAPK